ncbi:hypothetical protein QTP88_002332 [Uroleucon formosanum]
MLHVIEMRIFLKGYIWDFTRQSHDVSGFQYHTSWVKIYIYIRPRLVQQPYDIFLEDDIENISNEDEQKRKTLDNLRRWRTRFVFVTDADSSRESSSREQLIHVQWSTRACVGCRLTTPLMNARAGNNGDPKSKMIRGHGEGVTHESTRCSDDLAHVPVGTTNRVARGATGG